VKDATRPAIFKWRQAAPELILCAVRWYLRYSLSLRDVEELLAERGLEVDHTTGRNVGFNVTAPNWNSGCAARQTVRTDDLPYTCPHESGP
jgi:hypothetical protein